MRHPTNHKEQGFAHIIAIVGVVVLMGAVGTTGYYALQQRANDEVAKKQLVQFTEKTRLANEAADKKAAAEKKIAIPSPQTSTECIRDTTMYVTVSAGHRLRESRDMSAGGAVVVPYTASIKVGCLENGWYSADYNGQIGYVFAEYVSIQKPVVAAPTSMSKITTPTKANCPAQGATATMYAAQSPTVGFYYMNNPGGSKAQPIAYGSAMQVLCSEAVQGYVISGDAYYTYAQLSMTKP